MSPRKSVAETRRTRERIVERGVAIASVEGLEGLTIGRLATDLGMSKAGVLGHFGTKQALQLAALEEASAIFSRAVWEPAADEEPGVARLRAICEAWITYLERERGAFPGGCFFITASVEFDGRGGPVRDTVARLFLLWRRRLVQEVRTAVGRGELPAETDPDQIGFELIGLYLGLNQAVQLAADPSAADRTRRALDRLVPRPAPRPDGATGHG
ncbi:MULTISPECIES: TetR/AcrR family transcriptional regulator [unclassified Streptomyces]|uniref:TetR/AcrR family transcriptional regulator n=1 Tax=unclassified Streptomyces TaxID=2593676 RepID=UPI00056927B1|nr:MULTISPECIES: TetR/AcrR family transcriptional regulator [unclassified Streptomyces]MYT32428.1 TetR family transcriptional regulator [Streptomyces sp. SID8354]